MTSFLLLNPEFCFYVSGPAQKQKAVPVPFFGVVFMIYFPELLAFSNHGGF
jgi:hypothetical protein